MSLTIEQLWQQFRFTPNDSQRAAILHIDGPLYLPAGPGSGKTRVLLWRTINLIVFHGFSPDEIFLATFTEKAALQLREGVRALLGAVTNHTGQPYDIDRMYVGTVHSLCQRLLGDRRLYRDRHIGRAPALLDELSQYFLLYQKRRWGQLTEGLFGETDPCEAINTLFGGKGVSRHEAVMNCVSFFGRLSEECLDPETLMQRTYSPPLSDELVTMLGLYQRYREALGTAPPRTDFSLLQQAAYDLLAAYDGPAAFRHVIVDEYQDTNTIQERLYFALANRHRNLCVVGDDDQALYRFRGATVENFVQFPMRCEAALGIRPRRIPLATNYRSRRGIVDFYTTFMNWADWSRDGSSGGRTAATGADYYRVGDKGIHAASADTAPAVVATPSGAGQDVCVEIARFVRSLLDAGAVENANQIAFLFPSLKSVQVERMRECLEEQSLLVYAPRAGTFLEVDESVALFGVLLRILGRPERGEYGGDYRRFHDWMDQACAFADTLTAADKSLKEFVADRRGDIQRVLGDWRALTAVAVSNGWDVAAPYDMARQRRAMAEVPGLSDQARRALTSAFFDRIVRKRAQEGQPFTLQYILRRATSLDWNVLDLFYRICGFDHFKGMFDLAEAGTDEGPICNMGLISQYLARFMDEYVSVVTASVLDGGRYSNLLFSSYLYVLFRRGESEYEDAEDPFPRGRIPFLTIHQSKGLEFPVVVLGNTAKMDRGPQVVEQLVHPLLSRESEPLSRMSEFDIMRLFYVALSRAQNLLVLPDLRGRGLSPFPAFKPVLAGPVARTSTFDLAQVPRASIKGDDTPRNYSFTSDYLLYQKCPRQYMIFRKYGFVPSRSQTMMFGSLVHRTLDDVHQYLIAQRSKANDAS